MILEIIATLLVGVLIGAVLTKFLDKQFNLASKMKKNIQERQLNRVTRNPELLKKKLESNGEIVDDGEKISFDIVEGKLITKREKVHVPTPKIPGIPVKSKKKVVKKTPTKKPGAKKSKK